MKKAILFFILIFYSDVGAYDLYVSIEPQRFIAEQIVGDKGKVHVLLPQGANPHSYSIKIEDMRKMSTTSVFFTLGFSFEKNIVAKLKDYPAVRVVNMAENIAILDDEHDHGANEQNAHESYDTHFWMSPKNMQTMAENTLKILQTIDKVNVLYYEENHQNLTKKIKEMDEKFASRFNGKAVYFLEYHPSLGYFARDYKLHLIAVEKDGKSPKIAELKGVIDYIKKIMLRYLLFHLRKRVYQQYQR